MPKQQNSKLGRTEELMFRDQILPSFRPSCSIRRRTWPSAGSLATFPFRDCESLVDDFWCRDLSLEDAVHLLERVRSHHEALFDLNQVNGRGG